MNQGAVVRIREQLYESGSSYTYQGAVICIREQLYVCIREQLYV